ncbi:MAG: PAS domain-containing protein [Proteobacteria bacterium]|nr:PAS domain-containing protein [Pseudomonadota bacterium]MBU1742812.1 PAS domain-containing protein [Pseudomonadota bacterium]
MVRQPLDASPFQDIVSFGRQQNGQKEEIRIGLSIAQTLINRMSEGVMVLDPEYRIVWINDQALNLASLTRKEALGLYCYQVSHQAIAPCDSPETPCPMKKTLAQKVSAHAIHEHVHENGRARYCDVSTYPLLGADGQVVQVVEVQWDMTTELSERFERRTRALQEDLARVVQEDKLVALGKLVASVAHEINNPVSSIINFTKLILKGLREGPPTPEDLADFERYLDLTVREAERCGEIVTNLLTFSRQKSPEPGGVDMVEIVERTLVLMQHLMNLSGIKVVTRFEPADFSVWGDYNQLQQCLTNLLFNAVEAMGGGGTLTIRGQVKADKGLVCLDVSDTGCGISPEHVPHIFEPFFSTKSDTSGVGLGLAMVFDIVKSHGGDVLVRSRRGEGTTFRLLFPTRDRSAEQDKEPKR